MKEDGLDKDRSYLDLIRYSNFYAYHLDMLVIVRNKKHLNTILGSFTATYG